VGFLLVNKLDILVLLLGEMFEFGDGLFLILDDFEMLGGLFLVFIHCIFVFLIVLLFELELLLEHSELVGKIGDDLFVLNYFLVVRVDLVFDFAVALHSLLGLVGVDCRNALSDGRQSGVSTHLYYNNSTIDSGEQTLWNA
jgi:hypothetical protein